MDALRSNADNLLAISNTAVLNIDEAVVGLSAARNFTTLISSMLMEYAFGMLIAECDISSKSGLPYVLDMLIGAVSFSEAVQDLNNRYLFNVHDRVIFREPAVEALQLIVHALSVGEENHVTATLIAALPKVIKAMPLLDEPKYSANFVTNLLRLACQRLEYKQEMQDRKHLIPRALALLDGSCLVGTMLKQVRQRPLLSCTSILVPHGRVLQALRGAAPNSDATSSSRETVNETVPGALNKTVVAMSNLASSMAFDVTKLIPVVLQVLQDPSVMSTTDTPLELDFLCDLMVASEVTKEVCQRPSSVFNCASTSHEPGL